MRKIKTVAIVGGTHGNERPGVDLINELQKNLENLEHKYRLKIQLIHGNPRAIQSNKRGIEGNLNRLFSVKELNSTKQTYEHQRARQIEQLLGPKANPKVDFIIDFHTTTSDMGATLIFSIADEATKKFIKAIASHMNKSNEIKFLYIPLPSREESFVLSSIAQMGFVIEIGPAEHGKSSVAAQAKMRDALYLLLDSIAKFNQSESTLDLIDPPIFEVLKPIKFPTDSSHQGDHCKIHPKLLPMNYKKFDSETPVFLQGSKITFFKDISDSDNSERYPVFVGEKAYQGTAFFVSKRTKLSSLADKSTSEIGELYSSHYKESHDQEVKNDEVGQSKLSKL